MQNGLVTVQKQSKTVHLRGGNNNTKCFNKILALLMAVVMTAGLLVTGVSATTEGNISAPIIIHFESLEPAWIDGAYNAQI